MLALRDRKVWLYREDIDFRKQMNGLVQLIVEAKSGCVIRRHHFNNFAIKSTA